VNTDIDQSVQGPGARTTAPAQDEPPARLPDLAYKLIEEAIVTLRLAPGSVISEQSLSAMTGIGRTPIREAVQRLAREHLIIVLPQRGLLVSEMDVVRQLRLLETRREIERLVCRSAARRATDAERRQFARLAKEFVTSAARQDDRAFMIADLHAAIAQAIAASDVDAAGKALDALLDNIEGYTRSTVV